MPKPRTLADTLGPEHIQRFLKKWLERLPMPLCSRDRAAGYDYRLSIWQMEFSLTQIVDRPLAGRQFFEEIIRDNIDLGRPDRVQLIFPRKIIATTPGSFRTRVLREGVQPSLHISYKQFDLKQYFKLACPRRSMHGVPALAGCVSGQAQYPNTSVALPAKARLKPGLRAEMTACR